MLCYIPSLKLSKIFVLIESVCKFVKVQPLKFLKQSTLKELGFKTSLCFSPSLLSKILVVIKENVKFLEA